MMRLISSNTTMFVKIGVLFLVLLCVPLAGRTADENWLIGKWELAYDPDDVQVDWLEFYADGDVINIWADGTRVPGIYIVTPDGVKAVFTIEGKDLIATFHRDASKGLLKIVTSVTGKESLYRKLGASVSDE